MRAFEKRLLEALEGIADNTFSPNVCDSNLEPANLVDVLDRIASAIYALRDAVRETTRAGDDSGHKEVKG